MNFNKKSKIFICTIIYSIGLILSSPVKSETLKADTKNEMWIPKLDELIGRPWDELVEPNFFNYFPRMNIQEGDNNYLVEAELPGIKKEEIEIKLKDNYLIIKGEKKQMTDEVKKTYRRIERANGTFYRSVFLPHDIDRNKVNAELKDGILKIEIGRLKNAPLSSEKKILIK